MSIVSTKTAMSERKKQIVQAAIEIIASVAMTIEKIREK
jgi:hypothetical protein